MQTELPAEKRPRRDFLSAVQGGLREADRRKGEGQTGTVRWRDSQNCQGETQWSQWAPGGLQREQR